jgi:hypothetical protein
MRRRRKTGALVLALVVLVAAGVALWLSGRLSFRKPPWAAGSDTVDADAPPADASAAPFRRQTGPLSSAQLGAPLVRGGWVTSCGAPDTMKVVVKLDVKMGRAAKVEVSTDPPDPAVTACVVRAAHDLRWDVSPRTDHVTVRY